MHRRRRDVLTSSRPGAATSGAVPASSSAASRLRVFATCCEQFDGRFAGFFVIRPGHNPVGPLDFGGVYDERSDRTLPLAELTDRGYGDAYRQFIEPVVGAGGERIEAVQPGNGGAGRNVQL